MTFLENIANLITFLFLGVILSYYLLFFIKKKKVKVTRKFSSITIIIPAHNEQRYIKECIESVKKADFEGRKELIIVDDGSRDKTFVIAKKYSSKDIKVIKTKHSGKSSSLNKALRLTSSDLVAVVDADSVIRKDSLIEISKEVSKKNTAASSCVIKVRNRKKLVCMWVHIEQLYNSLMRLLLSKVNANIVTPGPLSVYRAKELKEAGGFSKKGFSEDMDVTIRLIRKGYNVGFSDKAVSETNMPYDIKGFFRQRTRFARGMLNIFKRHMALNTTIIDLYTLPILLFTYAQAVIMGSFTIYQIFSGYNLYFLSKGIIFNFSVLKFFFEWFSIVGFLKWSFGIFAGTTSLSFANIIGISSTLLTYPLYIFSIIRFDKRFDIWHLIPIFFMFPFWLLIMIIYILCLPEMFKKKQYNIWKKNEK